MPWGGPLQARCRMRSGSESSVTQRQPLMSMSCVGSGSMIPFKQWFLLLFLRGGWKPIIYIMSGVLTVRSETHWCVARSRSCNRQGEELGWDTSPHLTPTSPHTRSLRKLALGSFPKLNRFPFRVWHRTSEAGCSGVGEGMLGRGIWLMFTVILPPITLFLHY